jgi:hypothetical protein
MTVRGLRGILLGAVLVIVTACSGAPSTSDPSGAVQAAMSAASSGGFAKLGDFACAAKKNDIANAFGGVNLSQLQGAGINPTELFNAISLKFENVTTKEVTKSASAATVHLTADMTLSFDKDKMRAIMKTVIAAQGQAVDDATLDTVMGMMASQLSKSQKLDEDIAVVNEGGKWLLCG